jgi:hypothetical protein
MERMERVGIWEEDLKLFSSKFRPTEAPASAVPHCEPTLIAHLCAKYGGPRAERFHLGASKRCRCHGCQIFLQEASFTRQSQAKIGQQVEYYDPQGWALPPETPVWLAEAVLDELVKRLEDPIQAIVRTMRSELKEGEVATAEADEGYMILPPLEDEEERGPDQLHWGSRGPG